MEQNVILNLSVQDNGATKSVGSIRTQLREANQELIKAQEQYGEYSSEAVNAAKKVAELRDRVKEAGETAALFDPGQKFKAFSNSLSAVAGGFAAVQGALGLVGAESEDLQKQLLKVQSALALSEGLSRIADSAKDFRRLGAVIEQTTVFQKGLAAANLATAAAQKALGIATVTTSTGFKVLRGAIIATGIGALAIAVIAVVQNFDKLKAAVLNAVPGLQTIADGIGNIVNKVTDFLGITSQVERETAKALEENAKAIRKTEKELEFNADKYDEFTQRKIKANLEYRKSFEELTKDEKLSADERNKYIADARAKADREIARADKDRVKEANKGAEERQKKIAEQAKAEKEARIQAQKDAEEELAKLREDAILAAIKDESERAQKAIDFQVEADKKRIGLLKISEELRQSLITELEAKGERDRQAIRDKAAEDAAAKAKEAAEKKAEEDEKRAEEEKEAAQKRAEQIIANQQLEFDIRAAQAETLAQERQLRIDEVNAEFDQRVAKAEETGEAIANIEKLRGEVIKQVNNEINEQEEVQRNLRIQNAVAAADAIANTLGNVSKLVGEQTALGKTLAIAQAVIDTATSAIRAYQSTVGIPYVGPVLAPIAAATAVAFGVKNIRTIQQTKIPGTSGGGGGGSVPSFGNAQAAPIPAQANPQVVGQELNRIAINQAGNAAARAYVVESDVTNSQERIKRLNRAARLG
jgi:hypothetical protein